MAALLGVALIGVLEGIVIAVVLSLVDFVRRAWRPYDAVLGRLPHQRGYHDIDRHPDARRSPGWSSTASTHRSSSPTPTSSRRASRPRSPMDWPVAPGCWSSAEPITDIDTTGADMLTDLLGDLEQLEIDLAFAELKGPVKDRLHRYELFDRIADDRFFPTSRMRCPGPRRRASGRETL